MTTIFLKKIKNRLENITGGIKNVYLIYDEESSLSKQIGKDIINYFSNVKYLKLTKDRIGQLPNKEEKAFVDEIKDVCFLIFSDKGLDFKTYLGGKKLRDYLIERDIATFEIGRLKYFNTTELQNNLLFALEESISEEVEQKGLLLESKINQTQKISINDECFYEGPFEDVKYNFGLYKGQKNTLKGSLYPVGEILTEPKDLSKVNGKLKIYAFPNTKNEMIYLETPKYVYIDNGYLVKHDLGEEFDKVLEKIKRLEPNNNGIIVREMGFSINKNIKRDFMFPEISSAEKTYGYHISLGGRYGVYNKLNKVKDQNVHVDIMVDLDNIKFDDELIFSEGKYFFDK